MARWGYQYYFLRGYFLAPLFQVYLWSALVLLLAVDSWDVLLLLHSPSIEPLLHLSVPDAPVMNSSGILPNARTLR